MKPVQPRHVLPTGLRSCYDARGEEIDCAGTGQDAAFAPSPPWPATRFEVLGQTVRDDLTGLVWPRDANPAGFPLTWPEALQWVEERNREGWLGHGDWRLPNRREMRSLIDHGARKPCLPPDHPFENVFLGWRWTATTAARAPGYAWYVHLEGGRMFYGRKDSAYLPWPVRGRSAVLAATGQQACFNVRGDQIPCRGTGQDGELRTGAAWPEPRFETLDGPKETGGSVRDLLTGLVWTRSADLGAGPVDWQAALDLVAGLDQGPAGPWRLPNINELESLVDASRADPALPSDHPFRDPGEAYWSSTTSFFETDWAYCLYLHKGAVGVGFKAGPEFLVWAVGGP